MKRLTEWVLEEHIKKRNDLVNYLWCAVQEVSEKPTKKDMQWLKIACNDFVRIAKKKGWVE